MPDADTVWDLLPLIPRRERGFDHQRGGLPHFAIPPLEEGREVNAFEGTTSEGVMAASLLAIAEQAGYVALTYPCYPDRPQNAAYVELIAQELEDMARGLRNVLRIMREEREHDETTTSTEE